MKMNNIIINSVMKDIVTFAIEAKKYLFAVLLLIGTSVCAWGGCLYTPIISGAGAGCGANVSHSGDVAEGTEITLNITLCDGYRVSSITIEDYDAEKEVPYSGSGTTYTFTMPNSYNVFVTVTFAAVSSEVVEYHVPNCVEAPYDGEMVETSTYATATPAISGYTFEGWTTNGSYSASTTKPEGLDARAPGSSVVATETVYAVYSYYTGTPASETFDVCGGTISAGYYVFSTNKSGASCNAISGSEDGRNHISPTLIVGSNTTATMNPAQRDAVWKVEASGTYWTFKNMESGKYLAATETNNQLVVVNSITEYAKWNVAVINETNKTYRIWNKQNSTSAIRYYKSGNDYIFASSSSETNQNSTILYLFKKTTAPGFGQTTTYTINPTCPSTTFTVTYNGNGNDGGTVPVDNSEYKYGDAVYILSGVPTKTGYTFAGWKSSYNTNIYDYNGSFGPNNFVIGDEDITLTAQWTAAPSTLTIASPDNVTISATSPAIAEGGNASVTIGTTVTLSYSSIAGGYAWAGWNVYKTGDPTTTISVSGSNQFTMPNYDVTVDASLYEKSKLKTRCQAEVEFTIEGSVYLTSYAGVPVYTTDNPDNRITVTCADFGTADRLTITYMKNGEAVAKGNSLFRLCGTDYNVVDGTNDYISVSGTAYASGQKFVIRYTPEAGVYDRADTYTLRLTAQNGSTPLGYQDIVLNGRALPEKFVIAAQINGQWCALPSDLATSSGTAIQDAYPITVNNDVTAAIAAPKTAIYSAAARNNVTKHRGGVRLNTVTGSNDGHLQAPRSNDLTYLWRTSNNCSTGMQEWYLTSSDLQIYNIGVDPNIYVSSGSGGDDDTEGSTSTLLSRYLCVYGNKIMWTSSVTPAHREFRILPVTNEYDPVEMQVVEWKADGIKFMYLGNPAYTAEVEIEGVNKASAQALGTELKIDHGVYEITVSDLMSSAYKQMNIIIKNGATEVGRKQVNVPLIVNTETTIESARTAAGITVKANCSNVDLVILNGSKLSSSETTEASQFTFKSITIYGGGKLIVPAGNYLTAKKMYLRAGSVTAITKGASPVTAYNYVYPQVYVGSSSTLTINENIINFDYLTNYDQYFGVAFPHTLTIDKNNIFYPEDIYGSAAKPGSYLLRVFDSQIRAERGAVDDVWVDVETGSTAMPKQTMTTRGLGYYVLLPPRKVSVNGGTDTRQKYGIQRMKLSVANAAALTTAENSNATIAVTAYSASSIVNTGWWMLGNPYMASLGTGTGDADRVGGASITVGSIGTNAQGQYEWKSSSVRYVTVPDDGAGDTYDQRRVIDYDFPAFKPFYVQVGASGDVTFSYASRNTAAPARISNNNMPQEINVAVALSTATYGDTTYLLVGDGFSDEYEIGDDLMKMPHANVSLFTIGSTYDLFANALNKQSAENGVPVGYTAPSAGYYLFSHVENDESTWLEHLWLEDKETGAKVDLLDAPYEFETTAGTNKTRFVLFAVLKKNSETPTDIGGTEEEIDKPIKFIYNDKMYILRNGILYDATGKKVK